MVYGSHLYGTATADSDRDYKGVFMPEAKQILLGRVPKNHTSQSNQGGGKNQAGDIDSEWYSLHYFIRLACRGETIALDMLHAPETAWLKTSECWRDLVGQRSRFYSRGLASFIGYARKQAAVYGVKGTRLAEAKRVLAALKRHPGERIRDAWDQLPDGEYIKRFPPSPMHNNQRMYQVLGRGLMELTLTDHYVGLLQAVVDDYGKRARLAEQSLGVDWKAMSHAFRAAYQVLHIVERGGYSYPLPETDKIFAVKQGRYQYREVAPELDHLIERVETALERSTLPETSDTDYWDDWLASRSYQAVHTADMLAMCDRIFEPGGCDGQADP